MRVRAGVAAAVVAAVVGGATPAVADEVDVEAPVVAIVGPKPNLRVRASVTVTAAVTDNVGVTRVDVYGDNVLAGSRSAQPWTVQVDTAGRNGYFPIRVEAFDAAGNSTVATVTVIADNAPPTVTLVAPSSGAPLTGYVATRIDATDPAGIAMADLYVAGLLVGRRTKAPYSVMVSMTGRASRVHLHWHVTDKLGNKRVVAQSVIADNARPRVWVSKGPRHKARVRGTVRVEARATDAYGIRFTELVINRRVVARDMTAPYTFSINTNRYNGRFSWAVRAVDRAGNATWTATRSAYTRKW